MIILKFDKIEWAKLVYSKLSVKTIPSEAGVYCILYRKKAMYIGESANLRKRLYHHTMIWYIRYKYMDRKIEIYYLCTKHRKVIERHLISEKQPKHNIRGVRF